MMLRMVTLLLVLLFFIDSGSSHDWGRGKCPSANSFYKRKFDIDQFLGKWYVVKKSDTSSKCWTLNFNRKPDGDLEVVERSIPAIVHVFGSKSTYTSHGNLQVPNWEQSAKMRVKFTRNILGSADYTVVDTDFKNWALVFMCQHKGGFLGLWFKRQSAFLLVRDLNYDTSSLHGDVRKFLAKIDVDTDLNTVSHKGCKSGHDKKQGPPPLPTFAPGVEDFTEDLRVPDEPSGVIQQGYQPVIITKRRKNNDAEWITD